MISVQHEARFNTKDGQPVRVRLILPDDAQLLVDIFDHMSPESRYKRFNQALDSVGANQIRQQALHIVQADPDKNYGLIALVDLEQRQPAAAVGPTPVGAVRYVETAPGEAEVAISVRDDFQKLGIGTHLMRLLAYEARDRGYRRLIVSIRNDNPAVWRVFDRLPFEVVRTPEGTFSSVTVLLDRPRVPEKSAE